MNNLLVNTHVVQHASTFSQKRLPKLHFQKAGQKFLSRIVIIFDIFQSVLINSL